VDEMFGWTGYQQVMGIGLSGASASDLVL